MSIVKIRKKHHLRPGLYWFIYSSIYDMYSFAGHQKTKRNIISPERRIIHHSLQIDVSDPYRSQRELGPGSRLHISAGKFAVLDESQCTWGNACVSGNSLCFLCLNCYDLFARDFRHLSRLIKLRLSAPIDFQYFSSLFLSYVWRMVLVKARYS